MQELNALQELAAFEIVLASVCVLVGVVVSGFVCRLLLAVAKWVEAKTRILRHDLAVNNYREDD